jgi:hypothetical protein
MSSRFEKVVQLLISEASYSCNVSYVDFLTQIDVQDCALNAMHSTTDWVPLWYALYDLVIAQGPYSNDLPVVSLVRDTNDSALDIAFGSFYSFTASSNEESLRPIEICLRRRLQHIDQPVLVFALEDFYVFSASRIASFVQCGETPLSALRASLEQPTSYAHQDGRLHFTSGRLDGWTLKQLIEATADCGSNRLFSQYAKELKGKDSPLTHEQIKKLSESLFLNSTQNALAPTMHNDFQSLTRSSLFIVQQPKDPDQALPVGPQWQSADGYDVFVTVLVTFRHLNSEGNMELHITQAFLNPKSFLPEVVLGFRKQLRDFCSDYEITSGIVAAPYVRDFTEYTNAQHDLFFSQLLAP